ncbi:MAG: 23S rRNA (pseudouridine(1915)-N(3))-methyltransferase RlmH [Bacteroidales bacterium]|jgi:23S rRNA (pseudouridine1915-N3)-methyltransferase|nr:23S rRNA (pseudouridine(1915)-N(3))-methyltransferase RlmH [Bacteroidales bacterium]
MNIILYVVGKTDDNYLNEGTDKYFKRIKHYINFDLQIIKDIKNTKNITEDIQKKLEGEKILAGITNSDIIVLLDEKGKELNSREFSGFLTKQMNSGIKNLVFIIGGPYGFSEQVYERANHKISLSKMTFSHQIIRLIFAEQLYRAFTIINNEPYHHD